MQTAGDMVIDATLNVDRGYKHHAPGTGRHLICGQNTAGQHSAVFNVIAAIAGCIFSQKRQLIEQVLSWNETTGRACQVMTHGPTRVCHMFVLSTTAYNLTRIRTLGKASLQMA